VAERLKALAC